VADNAEQPDCGPYVGDPHPIFELCRAKQFDDALDLCRMEITANPDKPEGYRHMAIVWESCDQLARALPYRSKVIDLVPQGASHYSRGDLLYRMGRFDAAIVDFSRAMELDPSLDALMYLYRADCHRRLGNYAQALADCAHVPDDFDFPGFLGQWEGSKRHLLAEIERAPRDGEAT
jgi:tetratricopeptide (TPR) repeat protein